jgi:hypothetical protein
MRTEVCCDHHLCNLESQILNGALTHAHLLLPELQKPEGHDDVFYIVKGFVVWTRLLVTPLLALSEAARQN